MLAVRRAQQGLASTWHHLETFEVQKAACYDEADRPKVERNIAACMKIGKFVPMDASVEEALNSFNTLVRQHVLLVMRKSLGTSPFSYAMVTLLVSLMFIPMALDEVSGAAFKQGMLHISVWTYLLHVITACIAGVPLWFEVAQVVVSKKLHLTGGKQILWLSVGWLTIIPIAVLHSFFGRSVLLPHVGTSRWHLVAFVMYNASVLLCGAALWLWQGRTRNRWHSLRITDDYRDGLRRSFARHTSRIIRRSKVTEESNATELQDTRCRGSTESSHTVGECHTMGDFEMSV
jgi:hypothetical protein